MRQITYTIDVEKDLHSRSYKGITEGLAKFGILCEKHNVKPTLFVTADCLKKHSNAFKILHKKGWEISLHGFSHKRFDEMPNHEKEFEIKESLKIFKKIGIKPLGFRAPQHSIDDETLNLLEKYGFVYDSSYTPLNFLQLLFFPRKFGLWFKTCFSPLNKYWIRKKLLEIPPSSLFIPFVSLTLRIFPKSILKAYVSIISLFYDKPMFYAHSWDFIELKDSRIDRMFSHERLLNNIYYVMSLK